MSKMNCLQMLGRIFLLSVACTLPFLGASVQSSAQALQCGATISTNTTLSADLRPCANGLTINNASAPVTLNLNGHTISGSGGGVGVVVAGVGYGLTIKGPGKITNFGTGIFMEGAGDVLVYDLELKGNQGGMAIRGQTGTIRVLNNVIVGGSQATIGISLGSVNNVYIYRNAISGFTTAILLPYETGGEVDENLITLNQTGIEVSGFSQLGIACFNIRGNLVTLNQGTGIQIGSTSEIAAAATLTCGQIVEDNTVALNSGRGIALTQVAGILVQDNMVSFNKINGISITDIPGTNQVIGNRVQNNGTDLFWDGTGAPCWQQNIFNTSSTATLPPCS